MVDFRRIDLLCHSTPYIGIHSTLLFSFLLPGLIAPQAVTPNVFGEPARKVQQFAEVKEVAKVEVAKQQQANSTAPVSGGSSLGGGWAALRNCEAGGDYAKNTGNGYFGAYQMNAGFWKTYGDGSAPRADLASPAAQDAAAQKAYATRGSSPWPHCGKYL